MTVAAAIVALILCAGPVWAQAAPEAEEAEGTGFLPRYAFHLTAEHLSSDDARFTWDANYGGELDVFDYGSGRFTFYANYQVITGDQLRPFDANQGNYILGGRLSARVRGVEVAGVFHHLSRHLSDRPKLQAVDWNMVGVRVARPFATGATTVDTHVDIRGVVQRSFVDYRWEIDGGVRARHPITSHLGLTGAGAVRLLGVDGRHNRGTQAGARAEGGVRLTGRAGAIELFVALERRIDPYPLETGTVQWLTMGFKLLSE